MLLSIYYFLILLFTQSGVFICVGETQFPLLKKKKKEKKGELLLLLFLNFPMTKKKKLKIQ
jgi:hypothetical protein